MIRKFYTGGVSYPGLATGDFKFETAISPKIYSLSTLLNLNPNWGLSYLGQLLNYTPPKNNNQSTGSSFTKQAAASGINTATNYASGIVSDKIFGNDTELGRSMGTLFSTGLSSAGDTMANNLIKGNSLMEGLGLNVGSSLAGAGAGIAANYVGKGLTSAIGDNYAGRAIGAGVSTGLGTVGGTAASALASGTKLSTALSSINPYALAGNVVGAALSAGNGPSHEYGGKYGKITKGMDLAYDIAMVGVNAIPVAGQFISAAMALNKGLSNMFGSTDGMTKQDAILGSAFMPAPVKWLNMAGAKTTDSFKNLSWQNTYKANSFMGDAFGNLGDKFDKARYEAGKTYGGFSNSAYRKALNNINFANEAWENILSMADLNEVLNIRSLAMSSINNQRYALNIQGGWNSMARGKQGMKIVNNATNHNIGMRLLSGAALIDNKQMILCSVQD